MIDSFSVSLSGLRAATQKLNVSANNIANLRTSGVVPDDNPNASPSTVYNPLQAEQASVTTQDGAGAGVRSFVTERPNGVGTAFSPSSIYANEEGLIAVPNIDLAEESVNLITAKTAYKANIFALKISEEVTDQLLDELI